MLEQLWKIGRNCWERSSKCKSDVWRERDAFNPSLNLSNLYNSGREVNQLANIQSLWIFTERNEEWKWFRSEKLISLVDIKVGNDFLEMINTANFISIQRSDRILDEQWEIFGNEQFASGRGKLDRSVVVRLIKTVAGGWQCSDFDSNNTIAKTNISSTIANWISNSNTYSFLARSRFDDHRRRLFDNVSWFNDRFVKPAR